MGSSQINWGSSFNAQAGMFRQILAEADKVNSEALKKPSSAPSEAPKVNNVGEQPGPAQHDPLAPKKIEVAGAKMDHDQLLSNTSHEQCDGIAIKLGFKGVADFISKLTTQVEYETNVANHKLMETITYSLFSMDAMKSLGKAEGSQKSGQDEFVLVEHDHKLAEDEGKIVCSGDENGFEVVNYKRPEDDNFVTSGTVHVLKGSHDDDELMNVGVALAKLVMSGRLDEASIFAYVSGHACDQMETQDMAGASRACINMLRDKLEGSKLLKSVRAKIAELRLPNGNAETRRRNLDMAVKLEVAVGKYLKQLDGIFSRDVLAKVHTWGRHKGELLKTEVEYLEAQANKFTTWLCRKGTEDFGSVFREAEKELARTVNDVIYEANGKKINLGASLAETSKSAVDPDSVLHFIQNDLKKSVIVLRNEVKLARIYAGNAELRKTLAQQLSQYADNKSGRITPQTYKLNLGVTGGILFGATTSTSVRIGGGVQYAMTINVDRAGKVHVLSVSGPHGEVKVGAGGGNVEASVSVKGEYLDGKELVYDDLDAFLKNAATDVRLKLSTMEFKHFGIAESTLERKVDHQSFKALLIKSGTLKEGDTFTPKLLSQLVTDEVEVSKGTVKVKGKMAAGKHVAKMNAGVNLTFTRRTNVTYKARYPQIKDINRLEKIGNLKRPVSSDGKLTSELQLLKEELDDFEQAVKYERWNNSVIRKLFNRHTSYIEPPKKSLAEHLNARVPGWKPEWYSKTAVSSDVKARFLASIAATAQSISILAEEQNDLSEDDRKSIAEGVQALHARTQHPEIKVGTAALQRHLFSSERTDLGRTFDFDAKVSANANLHLPVVNFLGADVLGGLAPGAVVAYNYQHRFDGDRTGLPHVDNDHMEFFVGTTGSNAERVITAIVKSFANKLGIEDHFLSPGIAVAMSQVGTAISVGMNVVTGSTNKAVDEKNRFKATNVDLGLAKFKFEMGGDSGTGVKIKCVKDAEGKWHFDTIQQVTYSETQANLEISAMLNGFGGFLSVEGGFGSENVMGERLFGTSLSPLVRAANCFNLNDPGMKTASWEAFLGGNQKGIDELVKNLKSPGSPASEELRRYELIARNLHAPFQPPLADQLAAHAKALADAMTPGARNIAMTDFMRTIQTISSAHLKENPVDASKKRNDHSKIDLEAMRFRDEIDDMFDSKSPDNSVSGLFGDDDPEDFVRIS